MALKKSILVAKADLKMALQVGYVKYGLIAVAALGPILILAIVGLMAISISPSDPTEFLVIMQIMNPSIAPMLGIVAIIPASLIAANAFVGEREMNTLEPLLCTPLTDRELLIGKVLSSFIPSMALLLGSVFVSEIGTIVILLMTGHAFMLFPDMAGLFLLLTAAPLMILAMNSIMILISGRVSRVYEAYQTSGATILVFMIPMIIPLLSLETGGIIDPSSVWISNIITMLIALGLFLVTWAFAFSRFNRDKMVSRI
jgi:ABC-type transport system involved in multi-copper enzyme maturation permease subunit